MEANVKAEIKRLLNQIEETSYYDGRELVASKDVLNELHNYLREKCSEASVRRRQLEFAYGQIVRLGTDNYSICELKQRWNTTYNDEEFIIGETELVRFCDNVVRWLEENTMDYDNVEEFLG